ncbi:MAG TPA: glycoside hydrolase family 16 protein [Bacteroidales bacterium]|nr:glycoside hydrolase family 16 protein [Bacteroidales bacterium]
MKNLIIILCASSLFLFSECNSTKQKNADAQLLFEDNFDGLLIDAAKWQKCPEVERQGASEWRDENSYVENGNLVLKISPHDTKDDYVFTGAIRSRGLFERTYGYFEARIKFPVCSGTWGAFWLMYGSGSTVNNSGKDDTEIDIIESIKNQEGKANSALHWDGYGDGHKSEGMSYPGTDIYNGDFHTFALEWNQDGYVFYIDDVEKWRTVAGGVCQVPLYIKLTTEAAPWSGTLNINELPGFVLVDYVKVYDRKPEIK